MLFFNGQSLNGITLWKRNDSQMASDLAACFFMGAGNFLVNHLGPIFLVAKGAIEAEEVVDAEEVAEERMQILFDTHSSDCVDYFYVYILFL